jgi:hypothetical protein
MSDLKVRPPVPRSFDRGFSIPRGAKFPQAISVASKRSQNRTFYFLEMLEGRG